MGIKIHERELRGHTNMGWLDSRHTFSFGHFMDPSRMGFRSLRVINDDRVIGGAGFGEHGHDNMEIISIVLDGALEHKDSMGTGSIIRPGEIQKMSAGSGVTHSEYNASQDENAHFLQIWIHPSERNIEPSYEQVPIDLDAAKGKFVLIGGGVPSDKVVSIHQDAQLYWASLADGDNVDYSFEDGRFGFVHVARGSVEFEGVTLKEGDALEIADCDIVKLSANADSDVLLFDLG
ncbi:MAG: pirin family protein [Alphaproteobacteria bacterium]|nr:pirin family protein [Alphaproteobacteria bacterium]